MRFELGPAALSLPLLRQTGRVAAGLKRRGQVATAAMACGMMRRDVGVALIRNL
jgi:hypothetical protein